MTTFLDASLAYRIHRLQRLLRRHFLREAEAAGYDLTPEQFFLLEKLAAEDGQPQSALADEDLQDRPNLTRMLRELENRGLIARRANPDDRRQRLVHLTQEGIAQHAGFTRDVVGPAREVLLGGLDADDEAAAHRVFDQLEQAAR